MAAEGQLAQCVVHEADESYPTMLEIVLWFGKGGRKGKRVSVEIPSDQFYGRGKYGAPMSGDQLIGTINRLRKG